MSNVNVNVLATATATLATLVRECNAASNAVEAYRSKGTLCLSQQGKVWQQHLGIVRAQRESLADAVREFEGDVQLFRTAPAWEARGRWAATVQSEASLARLVADGVPARPAPHPWA